MAWLSLRNPPGRLPEQRVYWQSSKRIVEEMADALGSHPQLIAWQIDNGIGGNFTEASSTRTPGTTGIAGRNTKRSNASMS
jgi:beta-galactosidase GanA